MFEVLGFTPGTGTGAVRIPSEMHLNTEFRHTQDLLTVLTVWLC